MQLTPEHRKSTGAFYTPRQWAEFSVRRLRLCLPWMEQFAFYDPAAGEGALLDALPEGTERYATTLENGDVAILRSKGYEAQPFDFLTMNTDFLPDGILQASEEGRLVVLTNPPFFKLPADRYALMKQRYPSHCGDSTALFLFRIVRELKPVVLATWHKMDIYQSPNMRKFRDEFNPFGRCMMNPALTPSTSWPGLTGNFPIAFSIFIGLP